MTIGACVCPEQGYCPRFRRAMHGREYEICRGVNVDAGEAAAYRLRWQKEAAPAGTGGVEQPCRHLGDPVEGEFRECDGCGGRKTRYRVFACNHPSVGGKVTYQNCSGCKYHSKSSTGAVPLLLRNRLCPGDALVMTAAVYSLHRLYPGRFLTAVESTAPAVWEHNPDMAARGDMPAEGVHEVAMEYPLIHESNQRGVHNMQGYCDFLAEVLGVPVPLMVNRPLLYMSRQEESWMSQVQEITGRPTRYWVICAGHKDDYPAKFWGTENFQRVVNLLRGRVLFVQAGAPEHTHPPLSGVINLVGKTDQRQFIRLCRHAAGGLGGVTFLQHIMAAWEKPYVCVMGGREPVQWNSYPRQFLFHTVGALECCRGGGCWKSRVVARDEKDDSVCSSPVPGDEVLPRCMTLIRPEEVAERVLLADRG